MTPFKEVSNLALLPIAVRVISIFIAIFAALAFYKLYRRLERFKGVGELMKDLSLTLLALAALLSISYLFWLLQWLQTFGYIATSISLERFGMLGPFVNIAVTMGLLAALIASLKFVNELKLDSILPKGFKFKFMIMNGAFLNNLRDRLSRIFGLNSAEVILYALGEEEGLRAIRKAHEDLDQIKLANLSRLVRAFGFGNIRLELLNEGRLEALLHHSVEAAGVKADKPTCHFTRGFLAGSLEALTGLRAVVAEEECAAKGDQLCKFNIRLIEEGRIGGQAGK
ncbi:TPA: hypothetical protein EYP26_04825 [Candidatus Bathyarchaeota archaeon]|nr:hypothetical protein [Candidatus Bathyarchaeota archaeon]